MQYGMNENSSFGFCMFALTYATLFNDISKGYRIGSECNYSKRIFYKRQHHSFCNNFSPSCLSHAEYALAVAKGNNMAVGFVYGLINIWKEPLQAVLPELMKAYKEGMKVQVMQYKIHLSSRHVLFSLTNCATCILPRISLFPML